MRKRLLFAAFIATAAAVVCPAQAKLTSTCSSSSQVGNGVTRAFTFPCKFLQNSDVSVTVNQVAKTQPGDYTVSGAGNATGTITFGVAPASGALVVITRTVDNTQQLSLGQNTKLDPASITTALDKLTMQVQQVDARVPGGTAAATTAYVDNAIAASITGGLVVQPVSWSLAGDGATTAFSIPNAATNSPDLYIVTIDGVYQKPTTDYTVSVAAAQITFTSAPALNAVVAVRSFGYARALSVGDSTSVLATGATVPRMLKDWLGDAKNAVAYGADASGATDSSSAIQAAIDAANAAGGGVVLLPAGTYKANNLVWKTGVNLVGMGRNATTLKSSTANPLVKLINGALAEHHGSIQRMTLEGNSVGTIGLQLTLVARFLIRDVTIQNFTAQGMNLSGALVFETEKLEVKNSVVGVLAAKNGTTATNLVVFRHSRFQNNTTYGVDWSDGAMVVFDAPEFGSNGTAANAATGAAKFSTGCIAGEGTGVIIKNGWFESNSGHSGIRLNAPTSAPCTNVIKDTLIVGGTRTYGLHASGANVMYMAESVSAQNAGTADFFDDNTILLGFRIGCLGGTSSVGTQTTEWPRPSAAMTSNFIMGNPLQLKSVTQANLGTPNNGTILYCSDCTTASACTGGGTGAFASRQNGAWKCF